MFKGTGVLRKNLLGKDGRSRYEKERGLYKKNRVFREGKADTSIKKGKRNMKNIKRRK